MKSAWMLKSLSSSHRDRTVAVHLSKWRASYVLLSTDFVQELNLCHLCGLPGGSNVLELFNFFRAPVPGAMQREGTMPDFEPLISWLWEVMHLEVVAFLKMVR